MGRGTLGTVAVLGALGCSGSVAAATGESPPFAETSVLVEWLMTLSLIASPLILIALLLSGGWKLPPSARLAAWRLPTELSALVFAASILLGGVGSWVVIQIAGDDAAGGLARTGLATLGMYGGSLLPLVVLGLLWRHLPTPVGAEKPVPNMLATGLGAMACLLGLPLVETAGFLGTELQAWLQGASGSPLAHATLDLLVHSPRDGWWWVIALGALIAAPIVEETLYRGCLQQALRRLKVGRWWAILLTSGIFVLMHLPALHTETLIGSLVALLVVSILFGWIREWTGCLAASISAHVLFNAFNLAIALLL